MAEKSKPESKLLAPALTLEQQVAAEKEARTNHVAAELKAILDKYKCQIVPVCEIRGGQIAQALQIVAL